MPLEEVDVLVVGSGVAGLSAALAVPRAARSCWPPGAGELRERVRRVMTDRVGVVRSGEGLAELAVRREESRGGHWRADHPGTLAAWPVRQTLTRTDGGGLEAGVLEVPAAEVGR